MLEDLLHGVCTGGMLLALSGLLVAGAVLAVLPLLALAQLIEAILDARKRYQYFLWAAREEHECFQARERYREAQEKEEKHDGTN